jgi:hypothetical protein
MTPDSWADRLLDDLDEELRGELAADPAAAMRDYFGLTVRESTALQRRGDGGWCDGLSFGRHNEVLYGPSPFSKRMYFTMLHELGHKLTDDENDDDILNWLGELSNERGVVERVCDLVAGRLLVPDAALDNALEGARPTGEALSRLYDHPNANASREACAVALSRRLGCAGFIAVIRDDLITFTARLGEPRPAPWRDVPLPSAHPLRFMADDAVQAIESWWPDFAGERHRYYQHAFRRAPWTFAVFAENDLWKVARLHLPQEEKRTARGERVDFECSNCGLKRRTKTFRCNSCGGPACPDCEYCQPCDQQTNLTRGRCKLCTQSVLVHLLDANGRCPNCQ